MGLHSVAFDPTQVNRPTSRLNSSQTGRYSIYLYRRGIEGWVDLCDWLHTEMVYPPQRVTHLTWSRLSTNPTVYDRESNSRPVDHKSDTNCTTKPPVSTRGFRGMARCPHWWLYSPISATITENSDCLRSRRSRCFRGDKLSPKSATI